MKTKAVNYKVFKDYSSIYIKMADIIQFSSDVFNCIGPGLSERVYHNALEVSLREKNIPYETERIIPIKFKNHIIGNLRADLIVNNELVVEIKAVNALTTQMTNQLKQYLKLLKENENKTMKGILINFPTSKESKDLKIEYKIINE